MRREVTLRRLAMTLMRRRGYKRVKKPDPDLGLDDRCLLYEKDGEQVLVVVLDWRRAVGYNVLLKYEAIVRENGLSGLLVVASYFSYEAKRYAKRYGIQILDRGALLDEVGW